MTQLLMTTLVQEVRQFGWRVFDLADRANDLADADSLRELRSGAADASRHLARSSSALEERLGTRATEKAFKQLGDTVLLLDALAQSVPALAVDASSLAAEATSLTERVYDLLGVA